jgi:hypothetical protein
MSLDEDLDKSLEEELLSVTGGAVCHFFSKILFLSLIIHDKLTYYIPKVCPQRKSGGRSRKYD